MLLIWIFEDNMGDSHELLLDEIIGNGCELIVKTSKLLTITTMAWSFFDDEIYLDIIIEVITAIFTHQ